MQCALLCMQCTYSAHAEDLQYEAHRLGHEEAHVFGDALVGVVDAARGADVVEVIIGKVPREEPLGQPTASMQAEKALEVPVLREGRCRNNNYPHILPAGGDKARPVLLAQGGREVALSVRDGHEQASVHETQHDETARLQDGPPPRWVVLRKEWAHERAKGGSVADAHVARHRAALAHAVGGVTKRKSDWLSLGVGDSLFLAITSGTAAPCEEEL